MNFYSSSFTVSTEGHDMPFLVIDEVSICCRSAFPGQQIYLRTEHGTRDRTEIPPEGLGSRCCVVGNPPAA